MKVFRFYAPGDVRIEESPEPQVAAGEVKIRVRACSMCGTDVKIASAGHQRMQPPRVMGHEIAGEVVEVGEGVTGWAAGDRVQVIAAIPCGKCEFCTAGLMTICPNHSSMGYDFDGGFAPYMIVPPQVLAVDGLNRIPDGVSFAEASVSEPFACAINAQEPRGHARGRRGRRRRLRPHRLSARAAGPGPRGGEGVPRRAQPRAPRPRRRDRQARRRHLLRRDGPGAGRARPDGRQGREPRHHGRRVRCGAGAGPAHAGPARPDQPVRRPAQGQADDHPGLQPRALPR